MYSVFMPKRSSKEKDENEIARSILEQVTQSASDHPQKNPAAVALGRLGGLKGGNARAASLSSEKRKSIAKRAAKARWSKNQR